MIIGGRKLYVVELLHLSPPRPPPTTVQLLQSVITAGADQVEVWFISSDVCPVGCCSELSSDAPSIGGAAPRTARGRRSTKTFTPQSKTTRATVHPLLESPPCLIICPRFAWWPRVGFETVLQVEVDLPIIPRDETRIERKNNSVLWTSAPTEALSPSGFLKICVRKNRDENKGDVKSGPCAVHPDAGGCLCGLRPNRWGGFLEVGRWSGESEDQSCTAEKKQPVNGVHLSGPGGTGGGGSGEDRLIYLYIFIYLQQNTSTFILEIHVHSNSNSKLCKYVFILFINHFFDRHWGTQRLLFLLSPSSYGLNSHVWVVAGSWRLKTTSSSM